MIGKSNEQRESSIIWRKDTEEIKKIEKDENALVQNGTELMEYAL